MSQIDRSKILRIIDANFNRAKEGLRVCEDISRFVLDKKSAAGSYKDIRHQLTEISASLKLKELISARDVRRDVGRQSTESELKRKGVSDIFFANSQRVKESIRVLEEFSKLFNKKSAGALKALRYKLYAVEQKIIRSL